jgi:hypothetical protein
MLGQSNKKIVEYDGYQMKKTTYFIPFGHFEPHCGV